MLEPKKQLEIIKRGAVEIISEKDLLDKLERSFKGNTPLRIKAGFDPTAPDIHLGHTVLLEKMRQFQDLGHEVILLIGDFTAMIGDPTGKSETRKPLSDEDVRINAETYKEQAFKILDPEKTRVRANSEWLMPLTSMEIVRLLARQTVARMLEREDFKKRFIGQSPIGIHEFMYPLLQGYDSVMLRADVEIGGTDQKFNLLMGRELQEDYGQPPQALVLMPLLEGLDGVNKMSKSLGNYIGINELAFEYIAGEATGIFPKIMRLKSVDLLLRYYELLSRVSLEELNSLKKGYEDGTLDDREAKKALAMELVTRYHGKEEAQKARDEYEAIIEKKNIMKFKMALPALKLRFEISVGGHWLPQIMKDTGLAKSTSEAIRLIKQGGVKVNDVVVSDSDTKLQQGEHIIKVGKRRFYKVIIE
jgi:tyrosyl-tRNA synthetase